MSDKVKVRYIGSNESALLSSDPKIPSIQFRRYGQLLEMDRDMFNNIIGGVYGAKLAIMLDEDFQGLNHSVEELSQWGDPSTHSGAPDEFKDKVKKANELLRDIHAAASDR